MSKYFYHGVTTFPPCEEMLDEIKAQAILSSKKMGYSHPAGMYGPNYISVCRKGPVESYQRCQEERVPTAFTRNIQNHFCFIVRGDLEVLPTFPAPVGLEEDWDDISPRLFDEFLVKDGIPLSKVIGIGIPKKALEQGFYRNRFHDSLEELYQVATALEWDIVDTTSFTFIEEYEKEKEKQKQRIIKRI